MKSCFGQSPLFPSIFLSSFHSFLLLGPPYFLGLYNIYKRLWSCTSTFLNLPLLSCSIMQISVNKRILRIQNRKEEGTSCHDFRKISEPTGEVDLPHFPGASDRTLSHDCDHSFCQACNTANNNESMIGLDGESRCPVFRNQVWTWEPAASLAPSQHSGGSGRSRWTRGAREKSFGAMERKSCSSLWGRDDKVICWLCKRLRNTMVTTHSLWRRLPRSAR